MKIIKSIIGIWILFQAGLVVAQSDSILIKPKTTDYSFETGVSFTKFGKNSNGFTKYISPMTRYKVNEDLDVTFGATISQSTFNFNQATEENNTLGALNLNRNRLFSAADYQLSPRISIGGRAFYEYNTFQLNREGEILEDFDSKGMELNLNYHINENSHFNISVGVSEGLNYYDPFYYNNGLFNQGFNNHGFNSMQSPFYPQQNIFE